MTNNDDMREPEQTALQQQLAREAKAERDRHAAIDQLVATWTPTGDRVALAKIRELERLTESGIVIAGQNSVMGDKVERRGMLARVIAVGPEATLPRDARVYCANFAGAVLEIGGHAILIVRESELLMVEVPPALQVETETTTHAA